MSQSARKKHSLSCPHSPLSPSFSLSPPLPCFCLVTQAEQFLINTPLFCWGSSSSLLSFFLDSHSCRWSLVVSYCPWNVASCHRLCSVVLVSNKTKCSGQGLQQQVPQSRKPGGFALCSQIWMWMAWPGVLSCSLPNDSPSEEPLPCSLALAGNDWEEKPQLGRKSSC